MIEVVNKILEAGSARHTDDYVEVRKFDASKEFLMYQSKLHYMDRILVDYILYKGLSKKEVRDDDNILKELEYQLKLSNNKKKVIRKATGISVVALNKIINELLDNKFLINIASPTYNYKILTNNPDHIKIYARVNDLRTGNFYIVENGIRHDIDTPSSLPSGLYNKETNELIIKY